MREKKTVPEQVDDVRMMYHQFRPVAIGVEKNGIGLASLQYLQVAELPIYEFQDDADKYSRAVSIAGTKLGQYITGPGLLIWMSMNQSYKNSEREA